MTATLTSPSEETISAVRARFAKNKQTMTLSLARELGIPEEQVIRSLPEGQAIELDASRWEDLIRAFEPLGNLHVVSSNGAVTLECFGTFGNFSHFMGFFNVQTKSLDMHIRPDQLSSVFAVRKPSHMDGVDTLSFQFYDPRGAAAFKAFLSFGGSVTPPAKLEAFNNLVNTFLKKS